MEVLQSKEHQLNDSRTFYFNKQFEIEAGLFCCFIRNTPLKKLLHDAALRLLH
jgi:hypothetical protein